MGKFVTSWDKWHYHLSHMYAESQVHMLTTNNICKKQMNECPLGVIKERKSIKS